LVLLLHVCFACGAQAPSAAVFATGTLHIIIWPHLLHLAACGYCMWWVLMYLPVALLALLLLAAAAAAHVFLQLGV
jgi:hypothetical protein